MEKRPRQGSPKFPNRAESQAPLFPTDESSPKVSLRQPTAIQVKQGLRKQARKLHEGDWLAPAGSVQEKRFLEEWAKHEGSQEQHDLICKWLDNPNEFAKRHALFQQTAKKYFLGPLVNETARERHNKLDDKEWLVACFTSQGMRQREIAKLTHIGMRQVDNVIRSLKNKIAQELKYHIEVDDRIQIARWFLGL
jgi:hypothetical protein